MHPDFFLAADFSDLIQRVNAAKVSRTGGCHDRNWNQPFSVAALNFLTERSNIHTESAVAGDWHHGVITQAEQGSGFLNTEMADL